MKNPTQSAQYRGSPAKNPYIYTKKTVWMQRISDAVRAGSSLYIQGSTKLEKVAFRTQNFDERFGINRTKKDDYLWRKSGKKIVKWIGYFDGKEHVHWVLLLEPGKEADPSLESEKWKSVADHRITHTGSELMKLTRPGAKTPVLTWRYTRERYQSLRDEMLTLVRLRHDALLKQWIFSTARTPGFAGSREQVKKLWALLRAEWKRSRGKGEPLPDIPKNIGYVRRLPDVGAPWAELMRRGSADPPDLDTPPPIPKQPQSSQLHHT